MPLFLVKKKVYETDAEGQNLFCRCLPYETVIDIAETELIIKHLYKVTVAVKTYIA